MAAHGTDIWAHRGARSVAPENTMAAARAALAQGADGWELDVHITSDNEVIVIHDHGLRRTTNIAHVPGMPARRSQVVDGVTLAQVKNLDAGGWFARRDPFRTIAEGVVKASIADTFSGESVPTLDEALAWTREAGLLVNIELKDMLGGDDEGLARGVATCIRDKGMSDRVLISSFRLKSLEYFREICPNVSVGLLLDEKSMQRSDKEIVALLRSLEATALHPSIKGLPPGRVSFFRSAGFGVNVYTVNREEDIIRLIQEGATGIITDFPGRAKAVRDRLSGS